MKTIQVKLKDGIQAISNAHFEINRGQIATIYEKCYDPETMVKVSGKEIKQEETEETEQQTPNQKKSFKEELIDLNGIGPKIADKILKIAKSKEELAKIPRARLIDELRDDAVKVLDKYLKR